MSFLLRKVEPDTETKPRIFHIDFSQEVEYGIDYLLFQLLILGCLTDSRGHVWRKSPIDLYLIEIIPIITQTSESKINRNPYIHRCLDILPYVVCRSPLENFKIFEGVGSPKGYRESDILFDQKEFESSIFQRPFQYLHQLEPDHTPEKVNADKPYGTPRSCLQILLKHSGVKDPSWAELRNFVGFLNTQLLDYEQSDYVSDAASEFLPGFAKFVLKFLIQMSRDFATRSLQLSEETSQDNLEESEKENTFDKDLKEFQMRRTWEKSPHPYLFFNPDRNTMTFVGFSVDRWTGNLIDFSTKATIEEGILPKQLGIALYQNKVNMNENFDALTREEKLHKLCSVMGVKYVHDPDSTYELTMDNVKKILAIYMRFRCDIPVIIMGETGCGKTRLIQFMCQLQCPDVKNVQNMFVMKVHGGTTKKDIIRKVEEAEHAARQNFEKEETHHVYTVLFFDEANTTEAVGVIKEIMCDKTIRGRPLNLCQSLKIVAACNPYKKHTPMMIKQLEKAGLGFHVDAKNTTDRMGRIPMRWLVYRVKPLPRSLLPFVWDFGQLKSEVEQMYIKQMVLRNIKNGKIPVFDDIEESLSQILTKCQEFMREQKDECSFVSLRDVERVLDVFSWFYNQTKDENSLLNVMKKVDGEEFKSIKNTCNLTISLVLALGVCYHASLQKREEFRKEIAPLLLKPFSLPEGSKQMLMIIERCQDVFLENVSLDKNIAKNKALKENVFMMVVSIELRIPLFLVGKPGSSKSLAKTIVADIMQGNSSASPVFRNFKQVKMVSFQCSPLSRPEGIIDTFRQCAQFQKDVDLKRNVSVVVLDEVGLAEDSTKMPLKVLHPLLENGCLESEQSNVYKKVGFIGISNWSLDPAKMNRGILVQRPIPDLDELCDTAKGICVKNTESERNKILSLLDNLSSAYTAIVKDDLIKREFFGLRDFYSLIKMLYAFSVKNEKRPTWLMLEHSIKRNFGGYEDEHIDMDKIFQIFASHLKPTVEEIKEPVTGDPDCSPTRLIEACLQEKDSRYLLLLTENFGALTVLQQKILKMDAITIFGSSFRSDQEYTQICRNINRIKVCMETGTTVILLNLENLYESLYDALNQHYVYFGGERYVDLGLGSHRVKCRVHRDFRLIVVADKNVVYNEFPIPLINRLEKHFLNISTLLSHSQLKLTEDLDEWANALSHCENKEEKMTKMDVFIGYHADTCASIILYICHELYEKNYDDSNSNSNTSDDCEKKDKKTDDINEWVNNNKTKILDQSKDLLLWCSTPDAVLRLGMTKLKEEEKKDICEKYFFQQTHEDLWSCICHHLNKSKTEHKAIRLQITTNSSLLTPGEVRDNVGCANLDPNFVSILFLQSFDTEQQFCRQLRRSFEMNDQHNDIFVIIQCDNGIKNSGLIACAHYCVLDELQLLSTEKKERTHIVFILRLPRMSKNHFTGFQCGLWKSVHIDDLRTNRDVPNITDMVGKSIRTLFEKNVLDLPDEDNQENFVPTHEPTLSNQTKKAKQSREVLCNINRSFDFLSLVKKCVQSSLSMVKYPDNPQRSTQCVNTWIGLLHDTKKSDHASFSMGVCRHLCAMLEKTENDVFGDRANEWVTCDATKREYLDGAGTFRQAMIQYIVQKLSPLLAEIISKIDTNQNLDLIDESVESWKRILWLKILNCPGATESIYSKLHSRHGTNVCREFVVLGTRSDNHMFSAEFPFSWIIHKLVQSAINREDSQSNENIGQICKLIEVQKLGLTLSNCLQNIQGKDLMSAYIHDFLCMDYPVCSDNELELIRDNLKTEVDKLLRDIKAKKSGLSCIVATHIAYKKYQCVFQNFHCITEIWPNIQENLKKEKRSYWRTDKGQILDVLGLTKLVCSLEPKADTFTDKKGRQNWLLTVHKYRPVVEKIFYLQSDESSTRKNELKEARSQWTRIMVVKLFLENVCSVLDGQARRCLVFWQVLKGEADMKNISCLEIVEKVLKSCATELRSRACRKQQQCKSCESKAVERPVQLPCGDVICANCYRETSITGPSKCPACHTLFKADFKPGLAKISSSEMKDYETFKIYGDKFYRDVVVQLCFSEEETPSREVIERLMSHIINAPNSGNEDKLMSKNISILEEGFDQVPVVRSFLLQQILRTNNEEVENILETYINKTKETSIKDRQKYLLELNALIINCLEDSFMHKYMMNPQPSTASEVLAKNVQKMKTTTFGIPKLICLSESRFGLSEAANCLIKLALHEQTLEEEEIKDCIDILTVAQRFCTDCGSTFPRLFIVKCIYHRLGAQRLQELRRSDNEEIRKLIGMPELKPIQWCADRFIVCGQNYQNVRKAMLKSIFGNDQKSLKNALEILEESHCAKEIYLLLALFREVTFSNLFPPDDRRRLSDKQAMHIFEDLFEKEQLFTSQTAILQDVCRNEIHGTATLKWIRNNMELHHQNMNCLIFQFYVTLLVTPTDGTLLEPFTRLITCPDSVEDVLLPTMPQDKDDDDVIIAKLKEEQLFDEDDVYAAYDIDNETYCKSLNVIDSDTSEDEIRSNREKCCIPSGVEKGELRLMDRGEETTEEEQVLEERATQQKDVFDLPYIQCTTLRIFTRIAMYLGASKYPKVINTLLNSTDPEDIIFDNLWSHMEEELLLLQKEAGKCEEDVYLLLHYICNTFTKAETGHISDSDIGQLQTEDARLKWGKQFAESFLEEPLRDIDIVLSDLNKNLKEDNRIDPIMRLLVEREASEKVNLDELENIPVVWRYKSPITLDHLRETLEGHAPQSDFKILRMFLKEVRFLEVIRRVPNIIKLQRLLISCYQDKLERSDKLSIKEAIKEGTNSDLEELVNNFLEAWECVREDIPTFYFPTPRGKVYLPKDICNKITKKEPIGYLLPTFEDIGLCSYALLYFLLQKQNTFLLEYCKERRCQYSDLPVVHLKDLTSLHLITFHPTTDILPLIMANCQYTFEIDKGTRQEYIFADLENQLIDRFLFSKSVISWSSLSEFPLMTYACERTNAVVFRELRKRVKQEPLASEVFQKILDSDSTYPDIKTSLKNLDIAISFLKSVGGDINMSLESYLSQTLQIQNPLPVLKDKMLCHCKHAQSLWIALSLEQTKHNSSYKEDIFRVIPKAKRVEMNEEEKASVKTILQGKDITKAKKDRLLEVLFECIVLFIDVPEDEDSDVDKNSLKDTLLNYIKTPCYDISSITTHNATDVTDLVKQLPATIGNTKATDVWLCTFT
uniref:RING-type domain-containing protein n=1 Tax=Magallana gigas TaxID=29159 RepID=A0A8W8MGT1_MAGGI|nr:E3 ubiquitin-protein ligase rnf213-alpha-like isoform X1 [Crassostrea gigas]